MEVILALKKVHLYISDVHKFPPLKTKLLRLIFRLVERNQTDEDVLFWASFVLLHVSAPIILAFYLLAMKELR